MIHPGDPSTTDSSLASGGEGRGGAGRGERIALLSVMATAAARAYWSGHRLAREASPLYGDPYPHQSRGTPFESKRFRKPQSAKTFGGFG
ncbi:unnamed protein product [Darwinula stevensoni]|uniref:Uncharacterized protein n=1 Tax=Darwinula stevensoni TaxID=69355 RepID=A0A7R8XHG7_9CRUS|nr:unnamed protein product [Darwinula stevensoni]CAG0893491.1 unnamed protein product [Darwinula stevensoni]